MIVYRVPNSGVNHGEIELYNRVLVELVQVFSELVKLFQNKKFVLELDKNYASSK